MGEERASTTCIRFHWAAILRLTCRVDLVDRGLEIVAVRLHVDYWSMLLTAPILKTWKVLLANSYLLGIINLCTHFGTDMKSSDFIYLFHRELC
jgi:hypothetical protein